MRLSPAASMLLVTVAASFAQSSPALEGIWLTADTTAKIRFEPCAGELCGRLVWLRDPNDPKTGKPILDKHNPDPAQRSRQLLGIAVFTDIKAIERGQWRARAYNAEDSKTYEVTLQVTSPTQLAVKGCGLVGLICKTELWTRSQ